MALHEHLLSPGDLLVRIGIDARHDEAGIGRYTFSLIRELAATDDENEYVLFLRKEKYSSFELPAPNFEKVLADFHWYTLAEQVRMPFILRKAKLDLVHFPHFNVPAFYYGRYVVTIHDLHYSELSLARPSTLGRLSFGAKRLPYEFVLRRAVHRAERVIAVSEATRERIVDYLKIDPERTTVTYEGVDAGDFAEPDRKALERFGVKRPYFLYVGTAYPNKNLLKLIEAFAILRNRLVSKRHQLVLAGEHESFGSELRERARELGVGEDVIFPGRVSDRELAALYERALAYVFVSFSEGFGLPGLEAMAHGVPVLAARATSLPEIYGEAAHYVDPTDPETIAAGLKRLAEDGGLRSELSRRGKAQVERYSWRRMAEETLSVYLEAAPESGSSR